MPTKKQLLLEETRTCKKCKNKFQQSSDKLDIFKKTDLCPSCQKKSNPPVPVKKQRVIKKRVQESLNKLMGDNLKFDEGIGQYLLVWIALGKTIREAVAQFNEVIADDPENPQEVLTELRVLSWITSGKHPRFSETYYYAREVATEGVLDQIIEIEGDLLNDIINPKSARVILDSLRYRGKIQNPTYFNPVNKQEISGSLDFNIVSQVPEPRPLPTDEEIVDAEIINS